MIDNTISIMSCLKNDENCSNYKKTQPYCELVVLYDNNQKYCSNECKNISIRSFIHKDIENNMYLEKIYIECPLCNIKDIYLIELSCNHKICNQCMKNIFDSSNKCPICRIMIILKSENDKNIESYKENITFEHVSLIDTFYKLINSIDYEFDRNLLYSTYFMKYNRDVDNDINIIIDYMNMFKIIV